MHSQPKVVPIWPLLPRFVDFYAIGSRCAMKSNYEGSLLRSEIPGLGQCKGNQVHMIEHRMLGTIMIPESS